MINTTVDAFGTIVTVGDIVAVLVPLQYSNTRFKHFGKAKVVKCTPKGATVQIGEHKFNRKSELMVLLEEAQNLTFDAKECLKGTSYESCEMTMGGQVNTKGEILNVNPDRLPKIDDSEFKGDNK